MGRARRAAAAGPHTDDPPDKACAVCGRRITWRAKWARDWEHVRHCSAACRRRGLGPTDTALEDAIRELLTARARSATMCPSEAARRVTARSKTGGPTADGQAHDAEAWREQMEPARMAARRLVARGEVEIVQAGRVVDPSTAKGPIRVRWAR